VDRHSNAPMVATSALCMWVLLWPLFASRTNVTFAAVVPDQRDSASSTGRIAMAQQGGLSQGPNTPLGVIDGAKDSELVPDELAYHSLLAATALSDLQSPEQRAFIRARIARIGFSKADADSYELALIGLRLRDQLDQIAREMKSLAAALDGPQSYVAKDALLKLRDHQLSTMRDAAVIVRNALTRDGAYILDAHVREEAKAQLKLLSPGRMNSPAR
jgi:hypothetical protein